MKKYESRLSYYSQLISSEELSKYVADLQNVGIELVPRDKAGIPMAFLDDFTNQIYLYVSPELLKDIKTAVITSMCYDVLKNSILGLWSRFKDKKLTKVYADGETKEIDATFGIKIEIEASTKFDFRLSGNIPDEVKSHAIDKALEFAKSQQPNKVPNTEFLTYDVRKDEWEIVNLLEAVKKLKNQKDSKGDS